MDTYIIKFVFFSSGGPLPISPWFRDFQSRDDATAYAVEYADKLSKQFNCVVSFDIRKSRRVK